MIAALRTGGLLLALSVVLMVLGNFVTPGFLSFTQVSTQLKISAFLGLFALWQTFVLIAGGVGVDLAVGANAQVALLSGTHVTLVKIAVYAMSGMVAALSGFCLIGYVGAAFLGLGDAYVLSSIVVAVIGGLSLAGGKGSYIGVAAAAILITVLTSLLGTMQIGEAGRQIVFGCILVIFLIFNRRLERAA